MKRNHAERQAADENRTGRLYSKQAGNTALSLDEQIRTARIRLAATSKPFLFSDIIKAIKSQKNIWLEGDD